MNRGGGVWVRAGDDAHQDKLAACAEENGRADVHIALRPPCVSETNGLSAHRCELRRRLVHRGHGPWEELCALHELTRDRSRSPFTVSVAET